MMSEMILKWTVVVSGGLPIIGFLFILYAAYFVLSEIEDQLSNCKWITDSKAFWSEYSHAGKMYRYSILGPVLSSDHLLKKNPDRC